MLALCLLFTGALVLCCFAPLLLERVWLCSQSPCGVQQLRVVPLACPRGWSVLLDLYLPHQQWNMEAVKCDRAALAPLTQDHPIECDMHSAATHIWTGFSLHTNLRGLVTGQMPLSPPALAWHRHTHMHKLVHMTTQTNSSILPSQNALS